MDFIDLHVHSNASDGTLSPAEITMLATEKQLFAFALTDHDTVDGIAQVYETLDTLSSKNCDLIPQFIPGIELSCYYQNRELHILGFFIDYQNTDFLNALEDLKIKRENRNLEMVALFRKDGIDMTMEKLKAGNPNSVITRAHFARALMEEGICKTKDQAFKQYLGVKCPYYLPKPKITPEHAMGLIKKANGLAVLAHPYLYKLGHAKIEELICFLIPLGLDGIEAYHSSNYPYESDKLRSLALKYNLVITGGSDFHGTNKPDIEIGIGRGGLRIHKKLLENLRQKSEK